MLRNVAFVLLFVLSLSATSAAQTAATPQAKVNIIIDREAVRFAPQETAQELRLVVTDQTGAVLYDSGRLSLATLDWPLRDNQGEVVKSGLYLYTLTIKDAAGELSQRRGYLIVNRAGDADRVYVATGDKVGIGAGSEVSQVTVVGSNEATVGGAELPSRVPQRAGAEERAELPQRSSSEASRATAPASPHTTLATAGRLAKYDGSGNLIDSGVLETLAGGGLVDTFGNTAATGGAFNHVVEIVAASGKTPLTLVGGAGAMEFWKDSTPTSAIAFGVAKPAVPAVATDDMVFSAFNGATWSERMRLTNNGNLGIGTTNPADKLTVLTPKGFYGFTHLATDANGANPIALSSYVGGSASGATGGWLGTKTNHDLHFFTNGGQPSMTIIALGNVGIGTSTPTNKLHVESTGIGSVAVYGNVTNSGTGVWGHNNSGGTGVYGSSGDGNGIVGESNGFAVLGRTNSGFAGYFEGKVYVGGPLNVFGNVCAANIPCQSDARLKQAVAELHYGLREVLRLRPVRWDWKDRAERQLNLGLIAQEVEEVLPELVTTANDAKQTKGLNYIGLLPVVIKAIQEQQAALEQKETMLRSLKAENAALQQRNNELDARLTAVEQALQQLLSQQAQAQPGKRLQ